MKVLEEKIEANHCGIKQWFLNVEHQNHIQQKKKKRGKLDSIKFEKFVLQRTLSRKWKDNPWNEQNLFANNIFDKGLISKLYEELLQQKDKEI